MIFIMVRANVCVKPIQNLFFYVHFRPVSAAYLVHKYPDSPAKSRMQICGLTNRLLTEGCVPGTILSELQKYLNTERYGFNGDIVILLAQHNAPVNAVITFRGAQCTLLHGVASVCGSCPLTQSSERFHRYLVRNQPILDIEDEYGRTALAINY